MMSRFLLRLRRVADYGGTQAGDTTRQWSSIRFMKPETLTGNIGEPLQFGDLALVETAQES